MIPLLQGVRILELTAVVMGPYAGQILADLGAQVTKIEPLEGDVARNTLPRSAGMGAMHVNNNRNKRAVALDLKSAAGQEVLQRLIPRHDGLLHNMRHEAAQRLGIGFEAVAALNPQIVYCSAVGFGRRGRYRNRPAYDDIIQAASGLAGVAQHHGAEPRFVPTIVADKVGALHAVYGMLAAFVARERGRTGAIHVEVPMFEALASFLLNEHLAEATFEPEGSVGYARVLSKDRRPFRTLDGWIAVLPYTAQQWARFLTEVGRNDILAQPWFASAEGRGSHIDALYGVVAQALPERATKSWIDTLSKLDIPCSEVNRLEDLMTDPHLQEIGFFDVPAAYPASIRRMLPQPVVFEGMPARADTPPRALGADTRSVLRECGYSDDEIGALIEQRVVVAQ